MGIKNKTAYVGRMKCSDRKATRTGQRCHPSELGNGAILGEQGITLNYFTFIRLMAQRLKLMNTLKY